MHVLAPSGIGGSGAPRGSGGHGNDFDVQTGNRRFSLGCYAPLACNDEHLRKGCRRDSDVVLLSKDGQAGILTGTRRTAGWP